MKRLFAVLLFLPMLLSAQSNYAISFDGMTEYARSILFATPSGSITLEFWFSPSTTQAGSVFLADLHDFSDGDRRRIMPYLKDGFISLYANPATGVDAPINFVSGSMATPGVWYHLAVTINDAEIILYVNGAVEYTGYLSESYFFNGNERLTLGCDGWDNGYAHAKFDEVRLWNFPKTGAEINAAMNTTAIGNESGLIACYSLEGEAGAVFTDHQTNSAPQNGEIYGSWVGPATALPVELTSFNAAASNGAVTLQWKTATELNNYGFDIERKGTSESAWTKVGFISGNGTTNAAHAYAYTDKPAASGTYAYRLKQIDRDGSYAYSTESSVTLKIVPHTTALDQNYPNPFNPSTTIPYRLAAAGHVTLAVYDLLGRTVTTLVDGYQEAGNHSVNFTASGLPSGLYYYRLKTDAFTSAKTLTIMK